MPSTRRTQALALIIGLLGALTACQNANATRPSAATTPASAATTPAIGATTLASPSPTMAAPVLGPEGIGALKLGMTRAQAEATGVVAPFENKPNSDTCLWRSQLRGAAAGKGVVLHSEDLGVATLDAYDGVQTPEGITLGSSLAEVRRAYPDWRYNTDVGRGDAKVPGNDRAVYRIAIAGGNVVQLTLQYASQGCYE